jgi:hypothetical protein
VLLLLLLPLLPALALHSLSTILQRGQDVELLAADDADDGDKGIHSDMDMYEGAFRSSQTAAVHGTPEKEGRGI